MFAGLEQIRGRLPFALLGIDSDNGSEFPERPPGPVLPAGADHVHAQSAVLEKRPAHVEQKNWSVVRKLLGYDRYESEAALEQLNRIYALRRIWTNHWQPVLKLIGKQREGAKVTKRYDTAQTPIGESWQPGCWTRGRGSGWSGSMRHLGRSGCGGSRVGCRHAPCPARAEACSL